jgi:hypothetical protein
MNIDRHRYTHDALYHSEVKVLAMMVCELLAGRLLPVRLMHAVRRMSA